MTPAEALALCAAIGKRLKDPRELEAFRMAYAALRDDVPSKMRAIPGAHVALEVIPDETETWVAWRHGGPTTSAPTAKEALEALQEKVAPK